jgi:hypothetical protein
MAKCDTCGNDYDKVLQITRSGKTYSFDCFECAIHMLAPSCQQCSCRILGHGVEGRSGMFCCASCARQAGEHALIDRVA